jgi:energy-coupling factor transporter ATP-binding protein EcfA2
MSNPFSTNFWSPGVLPFQFPESDVNLLALLKSSLRQPVCQIVGPHGSGKTTLLLELLKLYEKKGANTHFLFFNDQRRQIPSDLTFHGNQFFFVDGVEQLPFWKRFWLLTRMKRVIFTVHSPVWLVPVLYRTTPQFSVFVQLVRHLTPNCPEEPVLHEVFKRSGGNFRSAFFELYDYWEG